jgi:acyl-coenzyme A synthetase/AMP-(fatty) acid ligase
VATGAYQPLASSAGDIVELVAQTRIVRPKTRELKADRELARRLGNTTFAGAATRASLPELIQAKFGAVSQGSGWGTTESGAAGSTMTGPVWDLKPLSAGILSPIVELRTTGADGRTLPAGSEGEIQLRGHSHSRLLGPG